MKVYREEAGDYAICAASDPGPVKRRNQDYFGIFRPETEQLLRSKGILIAVADGMGGLFRGERASRVMIDSLGELYFNEGGDSEPEEELRRAFAEGNRRVFRQVGEGMEVTAGTTCTAAILFPGRAAVAHVGDSRAYLIGSWGIRQLTRDHSREKYVSGMKGNGEGEEELKRDRRRVMTRSAGVAEEVEPDIISGIEVAAGDRIILCTDGLFSTVPDGRIAELALSGNGCPGLIRDAASAGGRDNITLIEALKV